MLASQARLLMVQSHYREAVEVARVGIAASLVHAPELEATLRITLGAALSGIGSLEEGVAELQRGLDVAREAGQADEIARAWLNLDYAYWAVGRVRDALDATLAGVDELGRLGLQSAFGGMMIANAGEKLFELGEWEEARKRFDVAGIDRADGLTGIDARTSAADLAVGQGRFEDARRLLGEASLLAGDIDVSTVVVRLALVEAELAAWEGRLTDGSAAIDRALQALPDDDRGTFAPRLAAVGVRIAADLATVAHLRRDATAERNATGRAASLRAAIPDGAPAATPVPGQLAAHAYTLLADAERSRLEPPGERSGDVRDPWAAAAAAFDALDSPYPAAYARFRQAEALFGGRGDRRAATASLVEANKVATTLGAAPLLAEIRGLAVRARIALDEDGGADRPAPERPSPAGLTERELEVLRLVALGRTNRQIATELFITEKTAGLHVSNILGKLGVANRVQAAGAARRLGLVADQS